MERELKFAEGHLIPVNLATKLTTVRQERDYYRQFTTGYAMGKFAEGNKRFPLFITHVTHSSLEKTPWIQLATDGWLDTDTALEDLQQYYPAMILSSPVASISFMKKAKYELLSPEQKNVLGKVDIEEAARRPETRRLFLRSLCMTITNYQGNAGDYLNLLLNKEIINDAEAEEAFSHKEVIEEITDWQQLQELVLVGKKDSRYGIVVLACLTK